MFYMTMQYNQLDSYMCARACVRKGGDIVNLQASQKMRLSYVPRKINFVLQFPFCKHIKGCRCQKLSFHLKGVYVRTRRWVPICVNYIYYMMCHQST